MYKLNRKIIMLEKVEEQFYNPTVKHNFVELEDPQRDYLLTAFKCTPFTNP